MSVIFIFLKPLKRGGEIGRDYLCFLSSIIKKVHLCNKELVVFAIIMRLFPSKINIAWYVFFLSERLKWHFWIW